jgi:acetyl esterase/lipase
MHKTRKLSLLVALTALAGAGTFTIVSASAVAQVVAASVVTRPVISEEVSPLEAIAPVASDAYRGSGFLRKPPGTGRFPAVVIIHPGLVTIPTERLKNIALNAPQPSRFLAAGYVVAAVTYRSRDLDPQATASLADSLAAVDYVRKLPYVDPASVTVFGCSGGGDLALEVAAATDVAAIAPEEPASVLLTGIFNKDFPKRGERHTPADAAVIFDDPKAYYTPPYQKLTREKLGRIRAPILILQGDQDRLNLFNAQVLIPELRALGRQLEVITYAGEPHCFAFAGSGSQTPRPAAALKAFQDAAAFFQRHLVTKPRPIDASQVTHVAIE